MNGTIWAVKLETSGGVVPTIPGPDTLKRWLQGRTKWSA